jgi:hypothetical protein
MFIDPVGYNFKEDVDSALLRLKIKHLEKLMKHNQLDLEEFEKKQDSEQVEMHIQVHMHLIEKRQELAKKIETTITK